MKESAVYLTVKMYTKKGKYQKEENSFLLFRRFPINSEIRNVWITNVRQINGYSWQPTVIIIIRLGVLVLK